MAVNRKASAKSKAKTANPDATGDGVFVYIGPSILGLIQTGTVYTGTREHALKEAGRAIAKNPLIQTLIVPGSTLAVDRQKVRTPGTALYNNYQRIVKGK